jgi:ADP-ribose pyrophosphatase YjhB (NUDIX family)
VTPRFCLACGAPLATVVADGHRRPRCPRCGWTYYANPVPATAAVVIAAGRLLLGRRARPPYLDWWDLPGGFLESDEIPEIGLRRELREELGVGVRHASLIGFVNAPYGPGGFPVLVAVYRVTPASRNVHARDDVAEARWFALEKIPYRRVAFPDVRRMLRRYIRDWSGSHRHSRKVGPDPL